MKVRDRSLKVFFRRKRIRQLVVGVEDSSILDPCDRINLTSDGNGVRIENCTRDARAMSLRSIIVGHVVWGDAGQEATAGCGVNRRSKPAVAFLYAAVDYADGGSIGRRWTHDELRLIMVPHDG